MMFNSRREKGFTLIELALVISIMSILALEVGTIYSYVLSNSRQLLATTEAIRQGEAAIDIIGNDLRRAKAVKTGKGSYSVVGVDDSIATYFIKDGMLTRKHDGGILVIGSEFKSISFMQIAGWGNSIFDVKLTILIKGKGKNTVKEFSGTFTSRVEGEQ